MGASQNKIGRSRRRRASADINITPLVDVMLVLLVIFMVTSPMLVSGINIDLPDSTAAPLSGQDEPISIDIDAIGNIYIQKNIIKIEELDTKLKYIAKEKLDSRIFVRGDKKADYGNIMKVVALINEIGFNKISLLTEAKIKEEK